ncbi:Cupredoxin [Lactifluus volemus]|nr:Cupredoxin [Lactifluus volemus]
MFFRTLILLSTVTVVALFSSNIAVSALPTQNSQVFQVVVGSATGETIFTPNSITARPGDAVMFIFDPKNHSVTQSSFENPCTRLNNGLDSDFHPVASVSQTPPTFSVPVKDSKPMWFYCRQNANTPASHCGKGMVFAVNAQVNGQKSFANFQAAAENIGQQLAASAALANAAPATQPNSTTTPFNGVFGFMP